MDVSRQQVSDQLATMSAATAEVVQLTGGITIFFLLVAYCIAWKTSFTVCIKIEKLRCRSQLESLLRLGVCLCVKKGDPNCDTHCNSNNFYLFQLRQLI